MRLRYFVLILPLVLLLTGPVCANDVALGEVAAILRGAAGDRAGEALAVGDLDGDTTSDLAIGAPLAGGPAADRPGAGAVYVVFGRDPFPTVVDLPAEADLILWGAVGDPDGLPPYHGDLMGTWLAVGDLNGDTQPDLLAGAPGSAGPASDRTGAGIIAVLLGPLTPGVVDLSMVTPDITIVGAGAGDETGTALALGQLTPGGADELLIGAPGADGANDLVADAGEAYILEWGGGLPAVVDLGTYPLRAHLRGTRQSQRLGTAVLLTDALGKDGREDPLLGVPGADGPLLDRAEAGGAYLLDAATLPVFPLDLAPLVADVTFYGADAGDRLGSALAAGDMDIDGTADPVLGAWTANGAGNTQADAGDAHVTYAGGGFPLLVDLRFELVQTWIPGADTGDRSAFSLAGTSLVGGVAGQVTLGAPFADGPGGGRFSAGEVRVVGPFPGRDPIWQLGTDPELLVLYGRDERGYLGWAVEVGDVTGDGGRELIAGAPGADGEMDDRPDGGEVYLVSMPPNAAPVAVAGPDQVLPCSPAGGTAVTLDGSNSTDADSSPGTNDDIVLFRWFDDLGGPGQTLLGEGEIISPNLLPGDYAITLLVQDTVGAVDSDEMQVRITETPAEASDLRVRRAGVDLIAEWLGTSVCADSYRIYRGNLTSFPDYDHSTPFTGGQGECAAVSPQALVGEIAEPGDHYYLVVGRNAAGSGSFGAGTNGFRPGPGEAPGVVDSCP